MPEQDRQWVFLAEVDRLIDGTELIAESPVRAFQQGDWITITTRKDILALSVNQLNKEGNPLVSSLSGIAFYLDHIEGERYRVRIAGLSVTTPCEGARVETGPSAIVPL